MSQTQTNTVTYASKEASIKPDGQGKTHDSTSGPTSDITTKLDGLLPKLLEGYVAHNPASAAQHQKATEYLPGGVARAVFYHAPFPIFMQSGRDSCVTSVDGREYLDFVSEYNATMYGHSHPDIVAAVENTLKLGHSLGAPNVREAELAQLLVDRFPSMDLINFTNSGTEANMMAIAVAKYYAKKPKVMIFENGYHGGTLSFLHLDNPLILPHDYAVGRFNDIGYTKSQLTDEVGVILVEPAQGAGGNVPAHKDFLEFLRKEATSRKAVLIFDEVVTSRLFYGGAQEHYGIMPDMTTIGKHWGGSFSFGGYGGKKDIMKLLDVRFPTEIYQSGTWSNNLWSMSAGIAATKLLTKEKMDHAGALGDAVRRGLTELFEKKAPGLFKVTGISSIVGIHVAHKEGARLKEALYHVLLAQGIYTGFRGFLALNITHTQGDADRYLQAVRTFCDLLF